MRLQLHQVTTLGGCSTPVHQESRRTDIGCHPNKPQTVIEEEIIPLGFQFGAENSLFLLKECSGYL